MLQVSHLTVQRNDQIILNGISFQVPKSTLACVLGPNGAGKSTLLSSVAGLSNLQVTGEILFENFSLTDLTVQERFQRGVFIAYQNPPEIEGLTLIQFLLAVVNSQAEAANQVSISTLEVKQRIQEASRILELPDDFYTKQVHSGLSGGQKKLVELLQILVLEPSLVLLDEIDSGLDIDKQKIVQKVVLSLLKKGTTILCVTHSLTMAKLLHPSSVLVIKGGKLVSVGDYNLLENIQKNGYAEFV